MSKRVRMSDIAGALGVSRTTVSRVLSGKAVEFRIAADTAQRIVAEAERLGYRPSELARGLRTSLSRSIGLIVSDISNPFFANVAWAAERAAQAKGFALLVGSSGEDLKRERSYIENLRARGADGLILAPAGPDYDHLIELKDEGYPFVMVDRMFDELDCDHVIVENQRAARDLAETLIQRGAKRLAFLGGRLEASTGRLRLEGYRAALRRHEQPFDNELVFHGDFSVQSGKVGAEQLLALATPPDAILCANNKILMGCLERLSRESSDPWPALPVASFDEVPFMRLLGRPLVIASQPEHRIGERAVEMLIERVMSGSPDESRMNRPFLHELLNVELKTIG